MIPLAISSALFYTFFSQLRRLSAWFVAPRLLTSKASLRLRPQYALKGSSSQVAGKSRIFEWYIGTPKIRRLQRILCRSGKALPGNQRLGPPDSSGGKHGVIKGKDALILDERPCTGQSKAAGSTGPVAVLGWTDCDDIVRRGRRCAVEPDNGTLPVMSMTHAVQGLIFGEVPLFRCQYLYLGM